MSFFLWKTGLAVGFGDQDEKIPRFERFVNIGISNFVETRSASPSNLDSHVWHKIPIELNFMTQVVYTHLNQSNLFRLDWGWRSGWGRISYIGPELIEYTQITWTGYKWPESRSIGIEIALGWIIKGPVSIFLLYLTGLIDDAWNFYSNKSNFWFSYNC